MNKHILLVDDEKEIVNFLESFLRRLKIPTIKATSGEEALKMFDGEKVGFVFMDIQMKGMDGITVLSELKKIDPNVQVIMITGKSEQEFYDEAIKKGAIDYITKPLDLMELKEKIHRYYS